MTDIRRQILETISEQSRRLQHNSNGPQVHVNEWSVQQWWEAFIYLFITSIPPANSSHHDDLLFFVKSSKHPTREPRFFVRRRGKQLPPELQISGSNFDTVNWPETVLLNIVLQSQYQLTVVACGRETLPFVAEGRTWSPGIITVTKPVYASTTVTAVNIDSSRAEDSNPQPCYPDICFAVDNFDNAFEDLVLEDADRCYCVVLHAILDHDNQPAADPEIGAAPASTASTGAAVAAGASRSQQHSHNVDCHTTITSNQTALAAAATAGDAGRTNNGDESPKSWQIGTRRRTLFAGYVSYGQILDFIDTNSRYTTLINAFWGAKGPQQDKVVMTGPGGVGRCEVAVKKVAQQPSTGGLSMARPASAGGSSDKPLRIETSEATAVQQHQQRGLLQKGLHKARSFASGVQQALSDVSMESTSYNTQCALMLLKLPVTFLATELLKAA